MEHISNIDCQKAFYCALHANRKFGYGGIDHTGIELFPILEDIRDEDCEPLSKHCESEWLVIPAVPVLFGFFQFVYFTNRSVDDFKASIEPDLVCFHAQACPRLVLDIVPIQVINGLTRFSPVNFSLFYKLNNFNDVFSIFSDYNRYCRKKGTETFCTNLSDFYCNKSMKCISYNRIGDGQSDCYYGEDEQFNACHLNDSNRFQCLSDPTKCLLQVATGDNIINCRGEDDEMFAYTQHSIVLLPYAYICNRDSNFLLIHSMNHTDESNCHWWPCDNPYTHCDEHWNCPNGIDELNCPNSRSLSGIIPPYFKTSRLGYYPSLSINHSNSLLPQANSTSRLTSNMDNESISYCNRGILVLHGSNQTKTCFCPPNYFGSRCQWQNQRISLTIQLVWRSMTFQMTIFELIIMLIDEHGQIEAYYERITYMPDRDCNTKYNLYLLYPDRPKSILRNYSIRIDIYEKINVIYWLSWYLPIPFQFLPVNRIATQIRIPELPNHESCTLSCGEHGKCMNYINNKSLSFCLCNDGYSSTDCNIKHQCHCADDSFCLTSTICICPLNKFGSYCHLKHSSCQTKTNNSCEHNGVCIPVDDRISLTEFTCFCPEDYSGKRCEIENTRIDIYLNEEIRSITSLVLIHFITSFNHGEHERRTLLRKISFNQKILTVYNTKSFHILFVQIPNKYYYLTILREVFHPSEHIRTEIQLKKRCFSIDQLILNETFQQYEYLRRVKYYPLLCRKNLELECFHDHEQMCLCDQDRFANCFLFNHTINNDCPGYNYCENQGQCFQNNATCPTKLTCICRDCYYGGKCQFSTRGFIFSLDTILAYHIKPKISLTEQSLVVKITYRRRGVERGQTVQHHLKHQIQQHQHLLYSPLILILLSLPRLIISFTRTCMRSTQQPWLFLIGYFLSFVPSMSIFVVFVLPSKTYKTEFNAVIEKIFKKFRTPQ
ncbi:hypothetical protein I4U23_011297 [Adineta vaga]|nr:hypothetical protein I4U23_011297 [Adineta vaga]